MLMDRNDMKVEKSVSMHSHTLELPCKHQIVTDTKSRNASHVGKYLQLNVGPLTVIQKKLFTFWEAKFVMILPMLERL